MAATVHRLNVKWAPGTPFPEMRKSAIASVASLARDAAAFATIYVVFALRATTTSRRVRGIFPLTP